MEYYAKSANKLGKKETVASHCKKVSYYCELNASHFNKAYEGRIIGKFHDFGKYGNRFQKILQHEESRINHEWAGALIVKGIYGKKSLNPHYDSIRELLIAIMSHHKGLDYFEVDNLDKYFNADFRDKEGRRMSISSQEEFNKIIKRKLQ